MSLVCINPEGLVDSILFSLGIFKFFSSYGTYFRIGENQRAKILQDERERLKNMYSILGNTTGDCWEDGSGICIINHE